jgi:hypothetical protein
MMGAWLEACVGLALVRMSHATAAGPRRTTATALSTKWRRHAADCLCGHPRMMAYGSPQMSWLDGAMRAACSLMTAV